VEEDDIAVAVKLLIQAGADLEAPEAAAADEHGKSVAAALDVARELKLQKIEMLLLGHVDLSSVTSARGDDLNSTSKTANSAEIAAFKTVKSDSSDAVSAVSDNARDNDSLAMRSVELRAFDLVRSSADGEICDSSGSSSTDRLTELLRRHPKLMVASDSRGMPLIVWAAKCRSREAMTALLNAGASVNTIYNGCSLLHFCCSSAYDDGARLLLSRRCRFRCF
jgi:hypothetical protein